MFVLNLLISWQTSRFSTLNLITVWATVPLSREGFFLATPAVTRGHGFCDLIIRTPLFICLASTTCRENRGPILICIPKGSLAQWLPYLTCMIVPCKNCESVTFILVLSLVLSTHCLINHLYWSRWAQIIFWSWSRSSCWSQF